PAGGGSPARVVATPADMRLRLDDNDRGTGLAGDDCGGHAGCARADDNDIGLVIPSFHAHLAHALFMVRRHLRGTDIGATVHRTRECPWRILLTPPGSRIKLA